MEELELEGAGLRLAARAWGDAGGQPVLAVHGWMDNAATFDRLAPLLDGVRLVSLDLPGHGRSEHLSPDAFYHFVDWVPQVLAAADSLGWERFTLLGHSMGGGVATLVAGVAPERVRRLLLIEALGPLSSPASAAPEVLRRSLAFRPGSVRTYPDTEAAVERLKRRGLSSEGAACLASRGLIEGPGGVRFGHDPRLRGPSRVRLTEPQVKAFIGAIESPTLVIRGSRGLDLEALFEARMTWLQNGQTVELPGGHHLHLDDPGPVAEAVLDFLRQTRVDPVELLGRHYRDNPEAHRILLEHSRGVTRRALAIAREQPQADRQFVWEAGMLHDIGIGLTRAPGIGCYGDEPYLRHGVLGRGLLEEEGLPRHAMVCERHVGTGITREQILSQGLPLPPREMLPANLEEEIICYADKFFSKGSGGELTLEQVRRKLARYGPKGMERFEGWRLRFEPEGSPPPDGKSPTSAH